MVLNVLIACEESQTECMAFRDLGHNAFSCDIQPVKRTRFPQYHILGDVTPYLKGKHRFPVQSGEWKKVPRWDLIIAHPPCTYLAKVGSMWLYEDANFNAWVNGTRLKVNLDRFAQMVVARRFFLDCLNATAKYVAVENPIPMRIANLPAPSTYIDPSGFGEPWTKKTLLWLRNLPPLMNVINEPTPRSFVHCSRGKYRSRSFPGVAKAMAAQWSDYILKMEG